MPALGTQRAHRAALAKFDACEHGAHEAEFNRVLELSTNEVDTNGALLERQESTSHIFSNLLNYVGYQHQPQPTADEHPCWVCLRVGDSAEPSLLDTTLQPDGSVRTVQLPVEERWKRRQLVTRTWCTEARRAAGAAPLAGAHFLCEEHLKLLLAQSQYLRLPVKVRDWLLRGCCMECAFECAGEDPPDLHSGPPLAAVACAGAGAAAGPGAGARSSDCGSSFLALLPRLTDTQVEDLRTSLAPMLERLLYPPGLTDEELAAAPFGNEVPLMRPDEDEDEDEDEEGSDGEDLQGEREAQASGDGREPPANRLRSGGGHGGGRGSRSTVGRRLVSLPLRGRNWCLECGCNPAVYVFKMRGDLASDQVMCPGCYVALRDGRAAQQAGGARPATAQVTAAGGQAGASGSGAAVPAGSGQLALDPGNLMPYCCLRPEMLLRLQVMFPRGGTSTDRDTEEETPFTLPSAAPPAPKPPRQQQQQRVEAPAPVPVTAQAVPVVASGSGRRHQQKQHGPKMGLLPPADGACQSAGAAPISGLRAAEGGDQCGSSSSSRGHSPMAARPLLQPSRPNSAPPGEPSRPQLQGPPQPPLLQQQQQQPQQLLSRQPTLPLQAAMLPPPQQPQQQQRGSCLPGAPLPTEQVDRSSWPMSSFPSAPQQVSQQQQRPQPVLLPWMQQHQSTQQQQCPTTAEPDAQQQQPRSDRRAEDQGAGYAAWELYQRSLTARGHPGTSGQVASAPLLSAPQPAQLQQQQQQPQSLVNQYQHDPYQPRQQPNQQAFQLPTQQPEQLLGSSSGRASSQPAVPVLKPQPRALSRASEPGRQHRNLSQAEELQRMMADPQAYLASTDALSQSLNAQAYSQLYDSSNPPGSWFSLQSRFAEQQLHGSTAGKQQQLQQQMFQQQQQQQTFQQQQQQTDKMPMLPVAGMLPSNPSNTNGDVYRPPHAALVAGAADATAFASRGVRADDRIRSDTAYGTVLHGSRVTAQGGGASLLSRRASEGSIPASLDTLHRPGTGPLPAAASPLRPGASGPLSAPLPSSRSGQQRLGDGELAGGAGAVKRSTAGPAAQPGGSGGASQGSNGHGRGGDVTAGGRRLLSRPDAPEPGAALPVVRNGGQGSAGGVGSSSATRAANAATDTHGRTYPPATAKASATVMTAATGAAAGSAASLPQAGSRAAAQPHATKHSGCKAGTAGCGIASPPAPPTPRRDEAFPSLPRPEICSQRYNTRIRLPGRHMARQLGLPPPPQPPQPSDSARISREWCDNSAVVEDVPYFEGALARAAPHVGPPPPPPRSSGSAAAAATAEVFVEEDCWYLVRKEAMLRLTEHKRQQLLQLTQDHNARGGPVLFCGPPGLVHDPSNMLGDILAATRVCEEGLRTAKSRQATVSAVVATAGAGGGAPARGGASGAGAGGSVDGGDGESHLAGPFPWTIGGHEWRKLGPADLGCNGMLSQGAGDGAGPAVEPTAPALPPPPPPPPLRDHSYGPYHLCVMDMAHRYEHRLGTTPVSVAFRPFVRKHSKEEEVDAAHPVTPAALLSYMRRMIGAYAVPTDSRVIQMREQCATLRPQMPLAHPPRAAAAAAAVAAEAARPAAAAQPAAVDKAELLARSRSHAAAPRPPDHLLEAVRAAAEAAGVTWKRSAAVAALPPRPGELRFRRSASESRLLHTRPATTGADRDISGSEDDDDEDGDTITGQTRGGPGGGGQGRGPGRVPVGLKVPVYPLTADDTLFMTSGDLMCLAHRTLMLHAPPWLRDILNERHNDALDVGTCRPTDGGLGVFAHFANMLQRPLLAQELATHSHVDRSQPATLMSFAVPFTVPADLDNGLQRLRNAIGDRKHMFWLQSRNHTDQWRVQHPAAAAARHRQLMAAAPQPAEPQPVLNAGPDRASKRGSVWVVVPGCRLHQLAQALAKSTKRGWPRNHNGFFSTRYVRDLDSLVSVCWRLRVPFHVLFHCEGDLLLPGMGSAHSVMPLHCASMKISQDFLSPVGPALGLLWELDALRQEHHLGWAARRAKEHKVEPPPRAAAAAAAAAAGTGATTAATAAAAAAGPAAAAGSGAIARWKERDRVRERERERGRLREAEPDAEGEEAEPEPGRELGLQVPTAPGIQVPEDQLQPHAQQEGWQQQDQQEQEQEQQLVLVLDPIQIQDPVEVLQQQPGDVVQAGEPMASAEHGYRPVNTNSAAEAAAAIQATETAYLTAAPLQCLAASQPTMGGSVATPAMAMMAATAAGTVVTGTPPDARVVVALPTHDPATAVACSDVQAPAWPACADAAAPQVEPPPPVPAPAPAPGTAAAPNPALLHVWDLEAASVACVDAAATARSEERGVQQPTLSPPPPPPQQQQPPQPPPQHQQQQCRDAVAVVQVVEGPTMPLGQTLSLLSQAQLPAAPPQPQPQAQQQDQEPLPCPVAPPQARTAVGAPGPQDSAPVEPLGDSSMPTVGALPKMTEGAVVDGALGATAAADDERAAVPEVCEGRTATLEVDQQQKPHAQLGAVDEGGQDHADGKQAAGEIPPTGHAPQPAEQGRGAIGLARTSVWAAEPAAMEMEAAWREMPSGGAGGLADVVALRPESSNDGHSTQLEGEVMAAAACAAAPAMPAAGSAAAVETAGSAELAGAAADGSKAANATMCRCRRQATPGSSPQAQVPRPTASEDTFSPLALLLGLDMYFDDGQDGVAPERNADGSRADDASSSGSGSAGVPAVGALLFPEAPLQFPERHLLPAAAVDDPGQRCKCNLGLERQHEGDPSRQPHVEAATANSVQTEAWQILLVGSGGGGGDGRVHAAEPAPDPPQAWTPVDGGTTARSSAAAVSTADASAERATVTAAAVSVLGGAPSWSSMCTELVADPVVVVGSDAPAAAVLREPDLPAQGRQSQRSPAHRDLGNGGGGAGGSAPVPLANQAVAETGAHPGTSVAAGAQDTIHPFVSNAQLRTPFDVVDGAAAAGAAHRATSTADAATVGSVDKAARSCPDGSMLPQPGTSSSVVGKAADGAAVLVGGDVGPPAADDCQRAAVDVGGGAERDVSAGLARRPGAAVASSAVNPTERVFHQAVAMALTVTAMALSNGAEGSTRAVLPLEDQGSGSVGGGGGDATRRGGCSAAAAERTAPAMGCAAQMGSESTERAGVSGSPTSAAAGGTAAVAERVEAAEVAAVAEDVVRQGALVAVTGCAPSPAASGTLYGSVTAMDWAVEASDCGGGAVAPRAGAAVREQLCDPMPERDSDSNSNPANAGGDGEGQSTALAIVPAHARVVPELEIVAVPPAVPPAAVAAAVAASAAPPAVEDGLLRALAATTLASAAQLLPPLLPNLGRLAQLAIAFPPSGRVKEVLQAALLDDVQQCLPGRLKSIRNLSEFPMLTPASAASAAATSSAPASPAPSDAVLPLPPSAAQQLLPEGWLGASPTADGPPAVLPLPAPSHDPGILTLACPAERLLLPPPADQVRQLCPHVASTEGVEVEAPGAQPEPPPEPGPTRRVTRGSAQRQARPQPAPPPPSQQQQQQQRLPARQQKAAAGRGVDGRHGGGGAGSSATGGDGGDDAMDDVPLSLVAASRRRGAVAAPAAPPAPAKKAKKAAGTGAGAAAMARQAVDRPPAARVESTEAAQRGKRGSQEPPVTSGAAAKKSRGAAAEVATIATTTAAAAAAAKARAAKPQASTGVRAPPPPPPRSMVMGPMGPMGMGGGGSTSEHAVALGNARDAFLTQSILVGLALNVSYTRCHQELLRRRRALAEASAAAAVVPADIAAAGAVIGTAGSVGPAAASLAP